MQKIILYTVMLFLAFVSSIKAQEKTFEKSVEEISKNIENKTQEIKKKLKLEIEEIDKKLENEEISKEVAQKLKEEASVRYATQLDDLIANEYDKLSNAVQKKIDLSMYSYNVDSIRKKKTVKVFDIEFNNDSIYKDYEKEHRTTTQLVLAFGFNNVVTNGAIANSDFYYWRSAFWEWGITLRTKLNRDKPLLNLKYGISFMYNHLSATDNRYFVENGNQTVLAVFPESLKKNETYFKNVYMTVPIHLEFDFSKPKNGYYRSHRGWRLGVGGYVGYNINSKQFLDYKIDGHKYKIKDKADWNVNDWNYGVSTYIGYHNMSLYAKYDISPIFKDNAVDQNNISIGLRYDFN